MSNDQSYLVNGPKIVHENIDGEVVTINLETGIYYSLNKIAADIWGWIQKGASIQDMVSHLAGQFQADLIDINKAIQNFVSELQTEGLIVPNSNQANPGTKLSSLQRENTSQKNPFEPPKLEKFSDMQEFLLVDPIHEVDEAGWPHKKEGSTSAQS